VAGGHPAPAGSSPERLLARVAGDLRRIGRATAYGGRVSRKPAFLAALASSAVPGLDPVSVRAAAAQPGHYHEVAFVTDTQHRKWVVRAPLTPGAGAQMDATVALLHLIGRRLPFSVPAPRGFVAVPEGRAVVYPHLSGRPVDFAALPAGPGLAAEVGRTIAALHNVDRAVFDEAGLPVYDAEEFRTRRLADLDRAAATGHVPTALLSRWERALEEVTIWRFAPTPIHGGLSGEQVLVVFETDDASCGRVRGVTGWDDAKVADPAEDFAALVTACSPEAFESVLEAYAHSRVERPDRHLRRRARLASELRLLGSLLSAVSAGERELIKAHAADLRELDEHTVDEPEEEPQAAPSVPVVVGAPSPAENRDDSGVSRAAGAEGARGEPQPHDDDEHTQPMNAGRFSEVTTVIPEDELERIRRSRVPETEHPATADAATAEPQTAGSETAEPQTAGPETAEPDTAGPETAEAGTAEPDTAGPETAEAGTAEPETAEPETAEAGPAEPDTAGPETAEAGPAVAGPAKTETSEPHRADARDIPAPEPGDKDPGRDDVSPSAVRVADRAAPSEERDQPATVEPPDRFR